MAIATILSDRGGISNFSLHLSTTAIALGELKSRLNLQLRRSFSAACSSLGTPSAQRAAQCQTAHLQVKFQVLYLGYQL